MRLAARSFVGWAGSSAQDDEMIACTALCSRQYLFFVHLRLDPSSAEYICPSQDDGMIVCTALYSRQFLFFVRLRLDPS